MTLPLKSELHTYVEPSYFLLPLSNSIARSQYHITVRACGEKDRKGGELHAIYI